MNIVKEDIENLIKEYCVYLDEDTVIIKGNRIKIYYFQKAFSKKEYYMILSKNGNIVEIEGDGKRLEALMRLCDKISSKYNCEVLMVWESE